MSERTTPAPPMPARRRPGLLRAPLSETQGQSPGAEASGRESVPPFLSSARRDVVRKDDPQIGGAAGQIGLDLDKSGSVFNQYLPNHGFSRR